MKEIKIEMNTMNELQNDLEYLKNTNKKILKDISERNHTFKTLGKKATDVKLKSVVFNRNATQVANKLKGKYIQCVSYGSIALACCGFLFFIFR